MLISLLPVVNWFAKFFGILFFKPQTRVRRLVGSREVKGIVEKEEHHRRGLCPNPIAFWTVRWDDAPETWLTYRASQFQWVRGMHTLFDTK